MRYEGKLKRDKRRVELNIREKCIELGRYNLIEIYYGLHDVLRKNVENALRKICWLS